MKSIVYSLFYYENVQTKCIHNTFFHDLFINCPGPPAENQPVFFSSFTH